MNESTWQVAQIMMAIAAIQSVFIIAVLGYVLYKLGKIEDKLDLISDRIQKIEIRVSVIESKLETKEWFYGHKVVEIETK